MDQGAFWRRCYGRAGPAELLSDGSVGIQGDDELGRRVLAGMAFMI